jgi:hypothetical protein
MRRMITISVLLCMVSAGGLLATVPQQVNYQGYLTDTGGSPLDTTVAMTFKLYTDSTGGTQLWTETHPSVTVVDGLFNVRLGQLTVLEGNVFNNPQVWLGINVGGDTEMMPRSRIVSVGYSYRVGTVDGASGGMISDDLLVQGRGNFGSGNVNTGTYAFVAGQNDTASGNWSTVSGGYRNTAGGSRATVGGGYSNTARGERATVGGGGSNHADTLYATVSGGSSNVASGADATVGGGHSNAANGDYATISGGYNNDANGFRATVGGGSVNAANGYYAIVSGGCDNTASGDYAIVGGGRSNIADTIYSTVSGGYYNTASGDYATVGGGSSNEADSGYATVGGGAFNTASGNSATVSGGHDNTASGIYATVGGGYHSAASGNSATVGGGYYNTASGNSATVSGGYSNVADGDYATIGSGRSNAADSIYATVGGGFINSARAECATVGGGSNNEITGQYSAIPGGRWNNITGSYSFAGGRRAKAYQDGCFRWADSYNADFSRPDTANTFSARAINGFWFFTNSSLTSGAKLASGASAWAVVSDSTKKRNLRLVDTKLMLDKVSQLPIKQWSYKSQDPSIEHIGPTAQDFWKLFHVGDDSLSISTIDPSGIALAAIQQLHKENTELKAEISELRGMVQKLLAQKSDGNHADATSAMFIPSTSKLNVRETH